MVRIHKTQRQKDNDNNKHIYKITGKSEAHKTLHEINTSSYVSIFLSFHSRASGNIPKYYGDLCVIWY